MLQRLRDKIKSILSIGLLLLLVLSFGVWGIGDIFRGGRQAEWVAKVGGAKIPPLVLQREFEKDVAQLRAVLGPEFTTRQARATGMMQRALDELVSNTATNLEIGRLGLLVGDAPIIASLEKTPELRNADGSFNRQMFERVLASQGMNEASFLAAQRQVLSRNILARALSMPLVIPDAAVEAFAGADAQQRVAEIVRIDPDALPAPRPNDNDLSAWYAAHSGEYQTPERRGFTVLRLTPADTGKGIKVGDEDIRNAYEQDRDRFDRPESRNMTQVVLESEAKAQELVEAARKEGGLSRAAKTLGLQSNNLEDLARQNLPETLAEAVFGKGVGEISGPVQTSLGWHVFTIEKIMPAHRSSFDEVKDKLRVRLQAERAIDSLVQTANKIDDMLAGGEPLEEIASSFGLKLEKEDTRAEDDKDIPAGILKTAFQQNEGEISPLMEDKDGGYLLVRTDTVTPRKTQPFEDVQDRVKADWQKDARAKKAAELSKEIAEKLKKGAPLSKISGRGVGKAVTRPFRFDEWEKAGVPRETLTPIFNLDKGGTAVITTANGGEVVLRVKNIIPAKKAEAEKQKAATRGRLEREWLGLHLDEFDNALRTAWPVEIDQKTLERMAAEDN